MHQELLHCLDIPIKKAQNILKTASSPRHPGFQSLAHLSLADLAQFSHVESYQTMSTVSPARLQAKPNSGLSPAKTRRWTRLATRPTGDATDAKETESEDSDESDVDHLEPEDIVSCMDVSDLIELNLGQLRHPRAFEYSRPPLIAGPSDDCLKTIFWEIFEKQVVVE
jgi:hypothetical protein